ncbi:unnamed protein product [Symbiodinium sp. CCMP2592]|nr:unnamed protein product [Symbiodinium sp. CCMP2592]
MEPDAPPGLGSPASQVGLDVSVLRELLRKQSELISAAGAENMAKLQRKWEECLDRVETKVAAQDGAVRQLSIRCCMLEDKLQQWIDERHGLEAESEIKLGLVKTNKKKRRGRRNRAAMSKDAECEQMVLVDSVDDVCETPTDMDVAMDQMLVGSSSAVLEPGEQDRTSSADVPDDLDGTRWSSNDERYWWKDTVDEQEAQDLFRGQESLVVSSWALRSQQRGVKKTQRQILV